MQPADRKRFGACLVGLSEIYGKPPSDAVISIWWDALKGYDFAAVDSAFKRHVQSPDVGQYMPKPADIIRMLAGTSLDGAMVAWAKVDKAVRVIGPYASVTFDDPIIQRVIEDMGGWIGLGTKTDQECPFIGNEFKTRYQGYRQRGEIPEYSRALIGIAEAENVRNGFPAGERTLIGDAEKARQIALGGSTKPAIGFTRIKHELLEHAAG